MRAGREVQRGGAGDEGLGVRGAEDAFRRGAAEHGGGPIVAQAGLVVREVPHRGALAGEVRQMGGEIGVQDRRVGELVQQGGAGELLGDGADAEQGFRREGQPAFHIGPAPGLAGQDGAIFQHRDRAARTWAACERVQHRVETGESGHGGRSIRRAECGRLSHLQMHHASPASIASSSVSTRLRPLYIDLSESRRVTA